MSKKGFYHNLEANFRGSREEILARLDIYIPFIRPFLAGDVKPKFYDLGCGRGEWLELTQSLGAESLGIDLDDGMLKDCIALNLSAQKMDVIEGLRACANDSLAVVSGFHIVEHLPFDILRDLIKEAYRVLQPGGLLILETPNAENINVAALTFYMDPTHVKPLPPGLLSYLPRYEGFSRSRVIRLQENETLRESNHASLRDVFQGVSPDYAVIAQKPAEESFLAMFTEAFDADYGLTFETLADRFENSLVRNAAFSVLENQVQDISEQLLIIKKSLSWRLTAPFRLLGRVVNRFFLVFTKLLKPYIKGILRLAIPLVQKNPILRKSAHYILHTFPWLKFRLKGLFPRAGGYTEMNMEPFIEAQLSPKARVVFSKLKRTLD